MSPAQQLEQSAVILTKYGWSIPKIGGGWSRTYRHPLCEFQSIHCSIQYSELYWYHQFSRDPGERYMRLLYGAYTYYHRQSIAYGKTLETLERHLKFWHSEKEVLKRRKAFEESRPKKRIALPKPDQRFYVLQKQVKYSCKHCNLPLDLMIREFPNTRSQVFYICWSCRSVIQVGVGVVKKQEA